MNVWIKSKLRDTSRHSAPFYYLIPLLFFNSFIIF